LLRLLFLSPIQHTQAKPDENTHSSSVKYTQAIQHFKANQYANTSTARGAAADRPAPTDPPSTLEQQIVHLAEP
jgi:hypothetical protein